MASMRFPAAASAAALAVSLWAASAFAAEPAAIDVRLKGAFAPDLVATIARIGRPNTLSIPSGSTFRAVVSERCGSVDPAYVEAFLRENAGLDAASLDALPAGTTYVFPACARFPAPAPRTIRIGETIERVFRERGMPIDARALEAARSGDLPEMSFACLWGLIRTREWTSAARPICSRRGFAAAENAARFMMANPGLDVRTLAPGSTTIVMPREPIWSTIPLREGVNADQALAEVEQRSRSAGNSPAADVARAGVATLVADTPIPEGACSSGASDWPFSVQELERALANNRRVRPTELVRRQAPVLVLDTGLDDGFVGRAIPANYQGSGIPVGPSSAAPRFHGVNLATGESSAQPPENLPNRLHGSEVGSVLLGGPWLEAERNSLDLPVRMIFASLAVPASDGSYLSSRAIYEALTYANRNTIPIINGSVFATEYRQEFINALPNAGRNVILITAAGNTGEPFEDDNLTWPGALGGDPLNADGAFIVTVGSHDAEGRISPFSRFGSRFVDLLAPGCSIPAFTLTNGASTEPIVPTARSGTSFATPIVSLVAALLYAEWVNPPDIKARLIMSVDVDGALANRVYSRGRLNLRKALSVWQDVAQYHGPPNAQGERDIRWAEGQLVYRNRPVIVCGQSILQSNLRKLSIAGDSRNPAAPRYVYAWRNRAGGPSYELVREDRCEVSGLSGQDIVIRESGADSDISIPLADVIDFVARSME